MFTINEDNSIYATRGDIVFFSVSATNTADGDAPVTFKVGDIIRMSVYGKKDCQDVVLEKDFLVTTEGTEVDVFLSGDETKFGDAINKPTDYWYEIELNPASNPQTIIGYDENGAKIFKLYPEAVRRD